MCFQLHTSLVEALKDVNISGEDDKATHSDHTAAARKLPPKKAIRQRRRCSARSPSQPQLTATAAALGYLFIPRGSQPIHEEQTLFPPQL